MAMTSNQRNTAVLLGSSGVTVFLSIAWLGIAGVSDDSISLLLRLSARVAFVLLLIVFVARPLSLLFKSPGTAKLLRNRRLVGIAFAGVHIAHFGLLVYKHNVAPDFALEIGANHLGVLTYIVIFAMLVTSWDRTARAIGPKAWKVLHKAGLYVLFGAFANTQLPRSLDDLENANWWLLALIAIALIIRLTAFFVRRAKAQPQ